jgi:hypothetical protein
MVEQHVNGARHRSHQSAEVSHAGSGAAAAGQPPPRPEPRASQSTSSAPSASLEDHPSAAAIEYILRNHKCEQCNVRVVNPTPSSARMHVEGAKHLLQIRLATWNPATGITALQKEQQGVSVALQLNGQLVPLPSASATAPPLQIEVGDNVPLRFDVISRSRRPVHLNGVIAVPSMAMVRMGINVRLPNGRVTILPGQVFQHQHILQGTAERIGTHRCLVVFQLSSALLVRVFDVSILPRGSSTDASALAPISAFVPKHNHNPYASTGKYDLEMGVKPISASNAAKMYKRPLGFYDVPQSLLASLNGAVPRARLELLLGVPLDESVYKARFQTLLHLEEIQMNGDIQDYDRETTLSNDSNRHGLIKIRVEGLAENRPSVQRGDQILASRSRFEGTRSASRIYTGYVHDVELEFVYLKFAARFHDALINGAKYFLRFTFNRIPLRRCHAGVEGIVKNGLKRVLFGRAASRYLPMDSFVSEPAVESHFLVTDDDDECDRWIEQEVLRASVIEIGIDTESMLSRGAGHQNELALLQLATSNAVILFRLFDRESLPPRLIHLLGLASVTKYSVGPERELSSKFRIVVSPLIDVQRLSMAARSLQQLPSLQNMADAHAPEERFQKDVAMQTSDWEDWPLSGRQMQYAASDASMALKLGQRLHVPAGAYAAQALSSSSAGQPDNMLIRIGRAFMPTMVAGFFNSSSSSSSSSSSAAAPPTQLGRTNRDLNEQQRQCVHSIVTGAYHPYPFLLFGPPGTGQLLYLRMQCARTSFVYWLFLKLVLVAFSAVQGRPQF